MLSEFEERLSHVPRWTIVNTIQKQSVMDHVGRVAISAPRIAVLHFGVKADDYKCLYEIVRYSLLHDQPEAFSGDISSPSKRFFMSKNHENFFGNRMVESPPVNGTILSVVKVTDLYEALVFLRTEQMLGNKSMLHIADDITNNLRDACGQNHDMFNDLVSSAMRFATRQQDALR